MAEDFSVAEGDVRLRVEGLSRAMRALTKAGADAADMRGLMKSLGGTVVEAAKPLAPYKTGKLQNSIRAGGGKTKAVVRAGGARTPYAGVIHYGWPAHNIEPHEFLAQAVQSRRAVILHQLDEGLTELLEKNDLL